MYLLRCMPICMYMTIVEDTYIGMDYCSHVYRYSINILMYGNSITV